MGSDYFEQFLNSLTPEERQDLEDFGPITDQEKEDIGYRYAATQQLGALTPAQKFQVNNLITYNPDFGEYGGYTTKEDLGFSPSTALYSRYEEWAKNNPVPDDVMTLGAVALRANPNYAPDYTGYRSPETIATLKAYDDAVAARSKAFEDLYKTPLSQLQYKTYTEAPSLDAYRANLASLGIDIPLIEGEGGYFVRAATQEDPEVQRFGIYNVGRSDYRQSRLNAAIEKNIELLKQQASQGIESSQDFLSDYVSENREGTEEILSPPEDVVDTGPSEGAQTPKDFLDDYVTPTPDNKPKPEIKEEVKQEEIAQALPPGPLGLDRQPGTYAPNNIIPLITPGSSFSDKEGYMIQDPFKNSPQTGPGLSEQPKYGPRGEDLDSVAWNTPAIPQGPYTPVRNFGTKSDPMYAPSTKDTHNNPSGQRVVPIRYVQENQPVDVRVARAAEKSDIQRQTLAQQSEFDVAKEKQLASARAAEAYRRSAITEDPFRAAARVG